jgi:YfiR/HmsC-like
MTANDTNRLRVSLRQRRRRPQSLQAAHFRAQFCAMALAALLTFAGATPTGAQGSSPVEYQVKAAFLFHFAQFVEWPEQTFKDANDPLTYCTIGNDPFRGSLDAALNGKTIGARPFRVLHFKQPQEIQDCQVLFVGAEEKKFLPAILAGVNGHSVLTVGESEHFVQDGGMIGFCLEENKIRFEINLEAAQKAKIRISSRLLTLAKSVIGGQKGT